jgi:hypothetical protein
MEAACCSEALVLLQPWRGRRYILPKHWCISRGLYSINPEDKNLKSHRLVDPSSVPELTEYLFLCSRCGSRMRGQNGDEWWSSRKGKPGINVQGRSPAILWETWRPSSLMHLAPWAQNFTSSHFPRTALPSFWVVHLPHRSSARNARARVII